MDGWMVGFFLFEIFWNVSLWGNFLVLQLCRLVASGIITSSNTSFKSDHQILIMPENVMWLSNLQGFKLKDMHPWGCIAICAQHFSGLTIQCVYVSSLNYWRSILSKTGAMIATTVSSLTFMEQWHFVGMIILLQIRRIVNPFKKMQLDGPDLYHTPHRSFNPAPFPLPRPPLRTNHLFYLILFSPLLLHLFILSCIYSHPNPSGPKVSTPPPPISLVTPLYPDPVPEASC